MNETTKVNCVTCVRAVSIHLEGCDYDAYEALGLASMKQGGRIYFATDVNFREKDDMLAAALMARIRRALPALVERCYAEAHDVVFPGDAGAEVSA